MTHTYTTTKRVPRKADKETKATGLKENPIYFQTQPTQAPDNIFTMLNFLKLNEFLGFKILFII